MVPISEHIGTTNRTYNVRSKNMKFVTKEDMRGVKMKHGINKIKIKHMKL